MAGRDAGDGGAGDEACRPVGRKTSSTATVASVKEGRLQISSDWPADCDAAHTPRGIAIHVAEARAAVDGAAGVCRAGDEAGASVGSFCMPGRRDFCSVGGVDFCFCGGLLRRRDGGRGGL